MPCYSKSIRYHFYSWLEDSNICIKKVSKHVSMYSAVTAVLLAVIVGTNSLQVVYSQSESSDRLIGSNLTSKTRNDSRCPSVEGQYDVTLNNTSASNSETIKTSITQLTKALNSSGITVVDVLENVGIIIVKSENQHLMDNIVTDLRGDPRVISVEPTGCVEASSAMKDFPTGT
jgi:hypothetical protein